MPGSLDERVASMELWQSQVIPVLNQVVTVGNLVAQLPKADIPAQGTITLLTQLTTRINAVTDALVSAGYAKYHT